MKLSRIVLVLGTFAMLLAARSAHAGWIGGYPCTVTYDSRANVGDKLSVSLYTQPYCAGSYSGSADFYGVSSTGVAQPCVQPSGSVPAATVPFLHERIADNYWRYMSIQTTQNSINCSGTLFTSAITLQMSFN